MRKAISSGLLASVLAFAAPHEASAAVTIDIGMADIGSGITFLELRAKGTFDTEGLMQFLYNEGYQAGIVANISFIALGSGRIDGYYGLNGPTSLGPPAGFSSGNSIGTPFGVNGGLKQFLVPAGFVSGGKIDADSLYPQTVAGLGLTPGQYVFTAPNDTVTVNIFDGFIPSSVPEPATWAMLLLGFGMIGFAMRKRSNVRTTVSYASPHLR